MLLRYLKMLPHLLESLNKTSIQRLLLYIFVIFQMTIIVTYREEISLLLTKTEKRVEIGNIPEAQERCFSLRTKYGAETVIVYIYQPSGKNKSYKERAVFSTGDNYKPLQSMQHVNLFSRADVISELNKNNYCIITPYSEHTDSAILSAFDLNSAVVTAIRSKDSKELVGEIVWLFKNERTDAANIQKLILEGHIFSHLMTL